MRIAWIDGLVLIRPGCGRGLLSAAIFVLGICPLVGAQEPVTTTDHVQPAATQRQETVQKDATLRNGSDSASCAKPNAPTTILAPTKASSMTSKQDQGLSEEDNSASSYTLAVKRKNENLKDQIEQNHNTRRPRGFHSESVETNPSIGGQCTPAENVPTEESASPN